MELGTIFIETNMKLGFTSLILIISSSLHAQKNDSQLISRHRPGLFWYFDGLRQTKSTDNHKYDRFVFDLTYNDWVDDLKPFKNRWNSIGFNVNFMKDIKFKKTKVFSLGLGAGYGLSSISSQQIFPTENNQLVISNIQKPSIYDHTCIKIHRLFIPLELRFSTKNWNRWKFVIGGSFGINAGMNQRMIGSDGSKMERTSLSSTASLLNYGIHSRLGYRNISLFGSYQINNLFRGRGNPDLHLFQLGLSISLF
jgi:hypothetical protein